MPHVVFMRAANVGGNNVFRPSELAKALSHLDVVNIGAAGTFVVRGKVSASAIRAEVTKRMPFAIDMMVRPVSEVRAAMAGSPFDGVKFTKDLRGFVAALSAKPKVRVKLPLMIPAKGQWALRVTRLEGNFALGLWQRPEGFLIPSNLLEQVLGVSATVRWWETYERIAKHF